MQLRIIHDPEFGFVVQKKFCWLWWKSVWKETLTAAGSGNYRLFPNLYCFETLEEAKKKVESEIKRKTKKPKVVFTSESF